jgi:hypothetical protein
MSIEDTPLDYLVRVKDQQGREFICVSEDVKNPQQAAPEELASCVRARSVVFKHGRSK